MGVKVGTNWKKVHVLCFHVNFKHVTIILGKGGEWRGNEGRGGEGM